MKFRRFTLAAVLLVLLIAGQVVVLKRQLDFPRGTAEESRMSHSTSGVKSGESGDSSVISESRMPPPPMPVLPAAAPATSVVLSKKTAAAMSRETSDLEVVTHPDGRRSVDLKGRFGHMSAIVTTPDGRSVVQCFSDAEALAAALSQNQTVK